MLFVPHRVFVWDLGRYYHSVLDWLGRDIVLVESGLGCQPLLYYLFVCLQSDDDICTV